MIFFPLWTARVCPTISGITVDRRDQVFTTFLSPPSFIASIFFRRLSSTKGPFFSDLDMLKPRFLPRRRTMNSSVRLLLRVLYPLVGTPQGLTGCRPPEVRPSPPPCGVSTGVIETPR